jgi:hypothetical protein
MMVTLRMWSFPAVWWKATLVEWHLCPMAASVLLAHLFCFAFELFMDFGLHAGV